jgi:hypothetical protein
MKKTKRILLGFTAFLMAAVLGFLSPAEVRAKPKKYVKSLTLSSGEVIIEKGSEAVVTATVKVKKDASTNVSVSSGKTTVATAAVINTEGEMSVIAIYGEGEGTAVIKVTTTDKNKKNKRISKKIKVEVVKEPGHEGIIGKWITTDFSTVYTYNADGTGNYQIFSDTGVSTADFKYTFDGVKLNVSYDNWVMTNSYNCTVDNSTMTLVDEAGNITTYYSADIKDSRSSFGGNCYSVFRNSASWEEAKLQCEKMGGHLATISSAEENAFIGSLLGTDETVPSYWLGGYRSLSGENGWQWVTGEEWSYTNWTDPGPRSEKLYLEMVADGKDYTWNCVEDDIKSYAQGYVCEWEADSERSTSPLIGTWEFEEGIFSWTFEGNSTGTWAYKAGDAGDSMKFWYHDNGDSVMISFDGWMNGTDYKYTIDGNKLTMCDAGGNELVYIKKIEDAK